jgi:hypothetical protein
MEDLFDTFNRLTQLRTREPEKLAPKAKNVLAGRYAKKKLKSHHGGSEALNEVYDQFELGGKSESFSKWLDLDHAISQRGDEGKFSELDYSPGPLEYSEDDDESLLISEENDQ